MPPTTKNTGRKHGPLDTLPNLKKRGRISAGTHSETPPKKSRSEKIDTSSRQKPEVPDMSPLPEPILGKLQTSADANEYKKYLRYLVAILFFKIRSIPEVYFESIIATSVPSGLKHLSGELIEQLKILNDDLTETIITNLRSYADTLVVQFGDEKVQAARDLAQTHRDRKIQIPRPFPNKDAVLAYMTLCIKDLVEIWAPILAFVDPDYIDNPGKFRTNWLQNLKESTYVIISRIASGIIITKRAYNYKSMITDFRATSCTDAAVAWPEHQLPFSHATINNRWGLISDTWPRKSSVFNKSATNLDPVVLDMSSKEENLDCLDETLSDELEAMEDVRAVNETDSNEQKDLANKIFDTPGVMLNIQFDEAYCTAESNYIAQLNTSGLTMYTIERIRTRTQTLKHLLVVVQSRLEEAEQALKIVEEDEERNRRIEAEVSRRQLAVDKDRKLYQSAKNVVHGTTSRRGATLSSILCQHNMQKEEPETKPGSSRMRPGFVNSNQTPETKRSETKYTGSAYIRRGSNTPGYYSTNSAPETHTQEGACIDLTSRPVAGDDGLSQNEQRLEDKPDDGVRSTHSQNELDGPEDGIDPENPLSQMGNGDI